MVHMTMVVMKTSKNAPHPLLDRLLGRGRRMGDRGASQPRLVGEDASADAVAHSAHDAVAHDTAKRRLKIEGFAENEGKRRGDPRNIDAKANDRHENKEDRHDTHPSHLFLCI